MSPNHSTPQQPDSGRRGWLLERQVILRDRLLAQRGDYIPYEWRVPGWTIPGRFAEMVAHFPDRPATLDTRLTYTYAELDEATNRVANALLARGGPISEIVALMVLPGTQAVIAALGTMKAGKAYVGFDTVFTEARTEAILNDSQCKLIICDDGYADLARKLAGPNRQVLTMDEVLAFPASAPAVDHQPDDLALLVYSSGTTGQPKGIVQTQATALAHVASWFELECYGTADRVASSGSLSSGSNFLRTFGALTTGACIAAFNIRHHGIDRYMDWLDAKEITVTGARAILRQLYGPAGGRQFPTVRTYTLGGDTIYRRDIEACRKLFPNAIASVGLGMTEASRVTQWFIDHDMPIEEEVVPVGFPVPQIGIVVLDEDGEEVEPGEVGEIGVLSTYLAKGYWQQPDLTATRFRDDARYAPTSLYMTGDMGRIGPDGMLRHMGRKDFWVKIRGYFVPTNEIEGLLLAQPGVTEAVVVKYTEGADQGTLLAYVVVEPGMARNADTLQEAVAATLPTYMVPQRILFLDELPHNARGKVDKSLLPPPDSVRPPLSTPYVAPTTPLELRIAAVWSELLSIDQIGLNDDFLALGGDSLQAMQMVNRLNEAFGVDMPAMAILSAATIAEMVELVHAFLSKALSDEA